MIEGFSPGGQKVLKIQIYYSPGMTTSRDFAGQIDTAGTEYILYTFLIPDISSIKNSPI
jgi:hypothetical protein